jgi:hypothetical protein
MENNADHQFQLIQLDQAVAKLTKPYHEIVYQETGDPEWDGELITTILELPPLIEQLDDAIGSTNSAINRGQGLANTRAVLDFSALALLTRIDSEMSQIWDAYSTNPRPKNLIQAIKRWHQKVKQLGPNQDIEPLTLDTQTLNNWVKAIDLKFDPPVIIELTVPCPACQAEMHENEEKELSHSLRIIWQRSFDNSRGECQDCGETWLGETEIRQLGWEIENNDTPTD